jgi:hypothetical protein
MFGLPAASGIRHLPHDVNERPCAVNILSWSPAVSRVFPEMPYVPG